MTAQNSGCFSSQRKQQWYGKSGIPSGIRRQKQGMQPGKISAGRCILYKLCLLFCCCAPLNAQLVPRLFLEDSSTNISGDVLDPDLPPSATIKNVDDMQQLYQVYRNLRSVCKDCDPSRLKSWMSSYYSPQMPTRSMPSMSQFSPGQNSKSPKAAWYLGRRKRETADDYDTDDMADDSSQLEVDPSFDKRSTPDIRLHPCLRRLNAPGKTLVNFARFCQHVMPKPSEANPFLNGGTENSPSFSKALAFVRLGRREQTPSTGQPASRVRSRSASGPVSWYLGKRSPLANWYLGKRMTASAPFARYISDPAADYGPATWYLGKRSPLVSRHLSKRMTSEPFGQYVSEPMTSSSPATWYLGKRSAGPVTWYLGKRSEIPIDADYPEQNGQLDDNEAMLASWPLYKRSTPSTTWYLGRRRR